MSDVLIWIGIGIVAYAIWHLERGIKKDIARSRADIARARKEIDDGAFSDHR